MPAGEDDLFANRLREGREGTQFERAFRLLCYLLDEWCSYAGPRNQTGPDEGRSLPAIYFDKFAMLVARIWGEYFKVTGRKLMNGGGLDESKNDKVISFPFPLQAIPGKHGRGLARPKDLEKGPRYILEILYRLEQENLLQYFRIDAYNCDPSDPRTEVAPGFPIPDREDFLKEFTKLEKDVLQDLATGLKHLSRSQIRALGTHCSAAETVEDIKREFRYLQQHGVWDRLFALLDGASNFSAPAEELLEYADEACRKAVNNREEYLSARRILMNECREKELRDVIANCQGEADAIWNNPSIRALAPKASRLSGMAKYLTALAHFAQYPSERARRTRSTHWHRWEDGLKTLDGYAPAAGLPTEPNMAFEGNPGGITVPLRDQLIAILNGLRREADA